VDLIILVILIAGFLIFRSSDRAKSNAYDRNRSSWQSQHDAWISRVVDQELTDRLEEEIYAAKEEYDCNIWHPHYTPNAAIPDSVRRIMDEVNAARREMHLQEIQESDYLDYLSNKTLRDHLLDILLANRGKLRSTPADFGFTVKNCSGPTRERRREHLENERQLIRYIDRKLKEHGIDEPLYFVGTIGIDKKTVPFGSEDPNEAGTYVWASSLMGPQ
jgi:hypothetical protein